MSLSNMHDPWEQERAYLSKRPPRSLDVNVELGLLAETAKRLLADADALLALTEPIRHTVQELEHMALSQYDTVADDHQRRWWLRRLQYALVTLPDHLKGA